MKTDNKECNSITIYCILISIIFVIVSIQSFKFIKLCTSKLSPNKNATFNSI